MENGNSALALAVIQVGSVLAFVLWYLVGKYPEPGGGGIAIALIVTVIYNAIAGIFVLLTAVGKVVESKPLAIAVTIVLYLLSWILSSIGGYKVGLKE